MLALNYLPFEESNNSRKSDPLPNPLPGRHAEQNGRFQGFLPLLVLINIWKLPGRRFMQGLLFSESPVAIDPNSCVLVARAPKGAKILGISGKDAAWV
jgi:hypothetical protein